MLPCWRNCQIGQICVAAKLKMYDKNFLFVDEAWLFVAFHYVFTKASQRFSNDIFSDIIEIHICILCVVVEYMKKSYKWDAVCVNN